MLSLAVTAVGAGATVATGVGTGVDVADGATVAAANVFAGFTGTAVAAGATAVAAGRVAVADPPQATITKAVRAITPTNHCHVRELFDVFMESASLLR